MNDNICGHCKYLNNNHCEKYDRMKGLINQACDDYVEREEL
jgi:hypothetical protein